jgi:hypothetical protein
MSYEIQESFQPRLYILSSNSEAIILESETEECKIVMYNNLTNFYENNTEEQFVISSSNEIFKISKDSNLLTSFIYNNNESIQYIDVNRTKQVLFDKVNNDISSDRGLGFVNDNFTVQLQPNDYFRVNRGTDAMIHSGYYPSGSEYRLGIGTNAPTQALHVKGNILSSGTIVASNLTVLGDTVTLNTVTSNTEQVVISNDGSGPALKVSQTGMNNIAEFYDDGQITLIIEDGGYVGIGTTNPVEMLDVNGNAKVSGSVSANSVYISGGDLYFEGSPVQLPYILQSKWTYDNVTESLYWNLGNVGIGTTYPSDKLHIDGGLFVNGDINLNNSNINVGTGNVTASTFTGTATRVSNSINIGSYLTGDNFDGSSASTISVDGTITPDSDKVVIRDSSSNIFVGGIGIGTGIVSKPLHVEGESYLNGVINTNSNSILVGTGTVYAQRFEGTASNIEYPLVIGTYLTGNNYDGSSVSTISVDGTSTPDANKVVVRDGSSNIYTGGVGIGTTSISYSLDVVGDINFTGNLYKDGSSFKNTPWNSNVNSTIYYNLGNVGIGTIDPINKLHVNGKSYLNGEVITNNNNINVGTGTVTASTFSGTATRVSNSLSTGDSYLVGSSFDGSSSTSWTINADSANGNSTIVARDGSGNFSAGTITANLTGNVSGNATSADKVNNSLSTGDSYLVGSSFDGSSSTSWTINADSANGTGTIVARDGSGNFSAGTITANLTGNVNGTATQVSNSLSTGDSYLVGSSFDGSSAVSWTINADSSNGNNTIVARDGSGNFSAGTINANLSGTATNVSSYLNVGTYLTGNNYNGSATSTIAVDGTTTSDSNKVVVRDGSANIYADGIGIGTDSASKPLHVIGDSLLIGNVGIGTNNPRKDLDIIGNVIQSGNLGIGTTSTQYSLSIHSSESVFTVNNGKVGISKGVGINPTTDLEIRSSSATDYTGILLKNNGNVYHSPSLRIQGTRFNNDSNIAYSANLGLLRNNPNAMLGSNIPLGLIHFGGNHTSGNVANNKYTSYIGALSESSFTSENDMPTSLVFRSGNTGYDYYDTSLIHQDSSIMVFNSYGNLGIGTSLPRFSLDVNGNINFAGSLYQDGSLFVSSEWTCNEDGSLYYNTGNVGLGTIAPTEKLHVEGNIFSSGTITASNLAILGDTVILNTITSNTEEVIVTNHGTGPALKVTQTGAQPIADFYDDGNVLALRIADGGLVGIGTDNPSQLLHVEGQSYLNGTVDTNNNNINAGTGTVTASTFSGTATQVSNILTVGSYLTGDNFDGSAASTIAVDATDANTASKVVARDVSGNFSAGTITATLSGNATSADQVNNTLTVGSYLTGDNFDGSADSTIAVDATSDNTASKVVARDASGNFSAGTITATLSGNATTATTATQVGNTLTVGSYLTGDNFDGSAASTIAVDATDANTASKVVARDVSGNFSAGTITATLSGNATSADQVNNTLTVGSYLTGDNFDGSAASTIAVDATDANTASKVVARDASGNFSAGTITATLSGTATQVSNTLTVGSYLTGDNFDGSSASTIAVDATDANTASKVVARDASGNFSAGTITASLSGNATTATTATQVGNTLTVGSYLTGDNFDGSSASTIAVDATDANTASKVVARDVSGNFSAGTITATLSGTATQVSNTLTVGSYLTGDNFDGSTASTIAVDATDANTASKVVARDASGNFSAGTITASLSGNATTATTATQVGNTLTVGSYLTGDNFDGSSASTIAVDATDANTASKVVARDVSGNFSAGTITATLSGTATQVSNTLTVGSYLTGDNFDGSTASTIAVDATDANTASKVVARDGSGNFSAGTITASLSGNATSADQVNNTLTVGSYLTGDNFDGSAASTIAVDATSANTPSKVVARDGSGNFSANNIVANGTLTASNLVVLGDTVQLDTITSNTEQMVITNDGTGPALQVTQTGAQPIADFYDDGNVLALRIADGGLVGIGTNNPSQLLHVEGQSYLNGTVDTNNNNINAGTGTVTASTFSGTATQVSSTLTRGTYLTGSDFDGSSATTWAVDATNANTASKVVARDASGNFSAGTITASLSGNATSADQVNNTLTVGSYLTGDNFDGSAASTIAVDATSVNTASKVVARDASGNFSAGTITATLSGNATTATTATQVGNTLTVGTYLTGDNFDGSAASTIAVDATSVNTASKVVARDASGNFSAGTITATLSGNATSADQVNNTLTVGSYLTGDNFDGSAASTIAVDATDANTASKVVARDASGNFSAGTITATLSGNATSADQVNNTLTVGSYLTGDNFDGSAASTIAVDATDANTANKVVARDASGNFSAGTITATLSGTATQVSNTLTVGSYLTGDNFDGSAASTIAVDATDANTASKVVARDGSGNFSAGTITLNEINGDDGSLTDPTFTFSSDTTTGMFKLSGESGLGFTCGNSEKLRIDSGGNVGIGTNNPTEKLDVNGNARVDGSLDVIGTNSLNLIGTDNVYMNFYPDGSGGGRQGYIGYASSGTDNFTISNQNSSGDIRFNTNTQVQMLINPDGNVGIGTNNPISDLQVGNITKSSDTTLLILSGNNNTASIAAYGSSQGTGKLYLGQNSLYGGGIVYEGDNTPTPIGNTDVVSFYTRTNGTDNVAFYMKRDDRDVIFNGKIGIGTGSPAEKLDVYGNTRIGDGLSGVYNTYAGGPFFKQSSWGSTGTSHTITAAEYGVAENTAGTINIQVKSVSANKLGNMSISFLNASGSSVELFTVFSHKTSNLTTMTVSASTNNITVSTDSDCAISWTSIGSC